jgi:hypothetical protein
MVWQCDQCGERHADSFVACWRCVGGDPAAARGARDEDFDEEIELESDDAPEIANQDAEQVFRDHVSAYQRAMGWYPSTPEDRWTAVGNGLHRFVAAYRLYRDRQESASLARPDLDRLWLQFFLSLSVMGGVWLGFFTSSTWADLLLANETGFALFHVGMLFLAILTGKRVVGRELRAAGEIAVHRGWRARAT